MKQRPISYSNTMVEAILADRKTMTRRPKRIQPSDYEKEVQVKIIPTLTSTYTVSPSDYGHVGDQLYVKEAYYQFGHWERDGLTKKGNPKWKFVPYDQNIRYAEDSPSSFKKSRSKAAPEVNFWYKRLARFMPRKYARIILEITELREERLQDISEEDAIREGVGFKDFKGGRFYETYLKDKDLQGVFDEQTAKKSFQSLWNYIYPHKIIQQCSIPFFTIQYAWDENPVVNVIGFKVIKK